MIYVPEQFKATDRDAVFRLIRENSFATLISTARDEPMVAHVPVLLDDKNDTLHAHVARANSIWREFAPEREVLFIFHGPHHYVSPSWYTVHPSVPTWNYAVVHVSGLPTVIEDRARIESMLYRLVDEHESKSKAPWKMDLPADYLQNMINGIVAFEVRITRIEGKFKLSQNRSDADRLNVVAALENEGGDNAVRLASLMEQSRKP